MTKNELIFLLEEKRFKELKEVLSSYNPVDIASLLSDVDDEQLVLMFRMIQKDKAAEVFSYMDNDLRQILINSLANQEITSLIDSMFADDAADLLSDMPANVVTKLLENVGKDTRADINHLLKYPEDSAGSIMTVEYIELHTDMTVKEALDKIRKVGIDSETVYTCYVVDKRKLIGIVSAKDLMLSSEDTKIKDIMKDNFISIKTTDDKEDAANLFRKYGLIAIPTVDADGYIVGIVTFDDAIDVLTDETTEDMQKMAAMEANDEPYLKTSVWKHAKHRIPWLLVLMLSATITGTIITKYENAFAVIPILVAFIPMLMDTGGNCGSQSATLVIRGLAVDEIHFADTLKVAWKEFRVAIIVSIVLAIANGIKILIMYKGPKLAVLIAFSLIFTIITAKLVGCLLPIGAKFCKLDPAIMASPLITTIVDTFSIMIYFNIATAMFKF